MVISTMKKKSLLQTNPFLKEKKIRDELILRSVMSSSRVEGIDLPVEVFCTADPKALSKPSASKKAKERF